MVECRRAVFLDRDGTLIDDPGFLHEPDRVTLLPGAADAVARLNRAGFAVVTVSNQSGIARGLYGVDDYRAVEDRLAALLAEHGARLDGQFHCPHHPEVTGPCDCRKPGSALFERAAEELALDPAASWWIGDRARDLEPARRFGGQAVLVETGHGPAERAGAAALGYPIVPSIVEAVNEHVLRYLPEP
jgi:D-glycero-D-manno-heptose 1,7-bisphosphate phosphatase